jgi:hypothetical protein
MMVPYNSGRNSRDSSELIEEGQLFESSYYVTYQ